MGGVECPAVASFDQRVDRAAALAGNRIAGQQSTESGQVRFERLLLPFQWKLGQLELPDFVFWQDGPIAVILLALPVIDTIKDRLDPVVIRLRKRIEFMVMTSATVDSETQKRTGYGPDEFGDLLFAGASHFRLACPHVLHLVPFSGDEEPGGSDAVAGGLWKDIAGNLLANELVVGQVGVETADDVIAVSPRVRSKLVVFEPVALCVTDHVEPMAAPAFAVVWRGEQPVDEPSFGAGCGVGEKGGQLSRCGRQAEEIEGDPSQESAAVDGWVGDQSVLGQSGRDEPVDGIGGPAGVNTWRRGTSDRLQRPPVSPGPAIGRDIMAVDCQCLGPAGSLRDPASDAANLRRGRPRSLAPGRHRAIDKTFQQQAVSRLARDNPWAVIARLKGGCCRCEVKTTLGVAAVMTTDTGGTKQGGNVTLE